MRPFVAAMLLSACSSVGVSADAAGGDAAGGDATTDARIDAAPQWEEVGSFVSLDMERFAEGVVWQGQPIIARLQDPPWIRRFDPDNGTAVQLMDNDDLCNCGYGGTLTAFPPSGRIYYFGNMGRAFDPAANMWTDVATYTAAIRRGEAATAVHQGAIWFVGGRDTPYTSMTFDPGSQVFTPLTIPDYPWGLERGVAASLGDVLYVMGGWADDSEKHMASFNGTTWTVLPDLPFTAGQGYAGVYQGKVVLLDEGAGLMGVFDPATTSWTMVAIPEGGGDNAIMMTDGTLLFVAYNVLSTLKLHKFIGTL